VIAKRLLTGGLLAGIAILAAGLLPSAAWASTFSVTSAADAGPGTLRQAILDANAHPGGDSVRFNLPGPGLQTIAITSPLPAVSQTLTINGRSQPGFAGTPLVRVDNASGAKLNGLRIAAAQSEVLGLELTRFAVAVRLVGDSNRVQGNLIGTDAAGDAGLGNATGVRVESGTGNRIGGIASSAPNVISGNTNYGVEIVGPATATTVSGNRIGTDPAGTAMRPNGTGVRVDGGATQNVIGGTTTAARNLISGNQNYGVRLTDPGTSHNTVEGNYVGTTANGTGRLWYGVTQGVGIRVDGCSQNTIGGSTAEARNVISGNDDGGVQLAGVTGTTVAGNYIGTNATGTARLGNGDGVFLYRANDNTIGGATAGARNVISGNSTGVRLEDAQGNTVSGNHIGTGATGTAPIGNHDGVLLDHAIDNTIGGTTAGARNLISANTRFGVAMSSANYNAVSGNVISANTNAGVYMLHASYNTVSGNYIGTDATGSAAMGNGAGVTIAADDRVATGNVIGGSTPGARNVISANTGYGVTLDGFYFGAVFGNQIAGNYIGTNAAGDAALPNGGGVHVLEGPYLHANLIGGNSAGARNVISGNTGWGVVLSVYPFFVSDADHRDNDVVGNYIGTKSGGGKPLGNGAGGVRLESGVQESSVAANRIAFNGGPGVVVDGTPNPFGLVASGDDILGNSIFNNAALGIDLMNGGNHDQAAPAITSVTTNGGSTTIDGTLDSTASSSFRIELFSSPACDPSGAGEGKTFLGSVDATTDGAGHATFSSSVPALPAGQAVTATATNSTMGDTSEFSSCFTSP